MKYLIVGAGGTGGSIGAFLRKAGHDVDFIARGEHLASIRENGLTLDGEFTVSANAFSAEEYAGTADVIFVCVKAYSLEEIYGLVRSALRPDSLVVPILNGLDIGGRLRKAIPEADVLDSCLYINAFVSSPGVIHRSGKLLRLVCADHTDKSSPARVRALAEEWERAGLRVHLSDQVDRDLFRKFMIVSPLAGAQIYFDRTAGFLQEDASARAFFVALISELGQIAAKRGFRFPVDMAEDGLKRVDALEKDVAASLYLDVKKGRRSEFEEQILAPIRLGEQLGVPMEHYRLVAEKMGYTL